MPAWIASPLALLGLFYLFAPWAHDWLTYGSGLTFAVVLGIWVRVRHRVTVLHRAEKSVVVWMRWTKDGKEPEDTPSVVVSGK
jgi:hypothetical protein